ncbi:DUF302 domain-containing protein [Phaeobacter sp.]|uniref:DUF302 domain-containing protein n=1 Tax=Phaeobacter sp. TaxID=1902409 RepID=UPI0025F710F3|nr:DUF302 domain-containing protein [Phaeobacter sp.]
MFKPFRPFLQQMQNTVRTLGRPRVMQHLPARVVDDVVGRILGVTLCASFLAPIGSLATAQALPDRHGWVSHGTQKPYAQLVRDVIAATKANGLHVVTQAGPTKAAAARGITIPGNRVIGVFNNDFAVRFLSHSTHAMIEAPLRLYVTETESGTGTLSYKTAAHVFGPYADDGGAAVLEIAAELDARLKAIAEMAISSAP